MTWAEIVREALAHAKEGLPTDGDPQNPLAKLMRGIIVKAVKNKCVEILLVPRPRMLQIRYFAENRLKKELALPIELAAPIFSQMRYASGLEKKRRWDWQKGRFQLNLGKKDVKVEIFIRAIEDAFGGVSDEILLNLNGN